MKEFFKVLCASSLFFGIAEEELNAILACLDPKKENFPKDTYVLRAGERTDAIGLVLSGSVLIVQENLWGERNLVSKIGPGQTFAAAYACAPGAVLQVGVVAQTPAQVLFLNVHRILNMCPTACAHHSCILQNLLGELAQNTLSLGEKLAHMGQRTTQAKVLSYLSAEAQRQGRFEFEIPFSRQQLADYLAVERSGLSLALGKLQKEGLLEFHKNRFILKV